MVQTWPPVTRRESGSRKWSSGCVPNGNRAHASTHSSICAMTWTRCCNEFDPAGTFALRSYGVRDVGMLVKARSLTSAFAP
jgi:hypothetical protein